MPFLILLIIPAVWVVWVAIDQPYDPSMTIFVMLAFECGAAVLLSRLYRLQRNDRGPHSP